MALKAMGNAGRIILRIEEFVISFGDGGYRITLWAALRLAIGQLAL